MEKKYQIIYIWSFIIVSGIILLLLYTPLGGDLHYAAYNEQGRYNVAPGVNYSSQVGGFSGGTSSGGSYNYSPSVSAYTSPNYKAISSANYSTATNFGSSASYSGGGLALPNRTVSGGGGAGSSGMGMMAVGGGRKSSNEVSNAFSGGGSMGGSLFNTTTLADGGVMQKGTNDEDDPPPVNPLDPGGDPTNPPLPLGDDIKILLLFGVVFAFYKWLTISKK
jgi:hypothetical protein